MLKTTKTWITELEKDLMLPPGMILETPDMITTEKGIYAFTDKLWPNFFVYVGCATGEGGLYQRIVEQHLNPSYLETRAEKHIVGKDDYQMEEGNHAIINGKPAIDKSSFRKNLARKERLKVSETVDYILHHFMLQYLPLPDYTDDELYEIEKAIIAESKPIYNIIHQK